jgi:hypothetical protein
MMLQRGKVLATLYYPLPHLFLVVEGYGAKRMKL